MSLPDQSVGPPWDPTATRLTYPRLARLVHVCRLKPSEALVLQAVVERDYDYDRGVRPGQVEVSQAQVADELGLGENTIRRALAGLETSGLIAVASQGRGRPILVVVDYGAMSAVWARDIPALNHLGRTANLEVPQAQTTANLEVVRTANLEVPELRTANLEVPQAQTTAKLAVPHIKESSPDPDPVVVDDDAAFAAELDAARRTPAALPPRLPADRPDERPDERPEVVQRPRFDDAGEDRRPRFADAEEDRRPLPSDRAARQFLLAPSWLDMPRSNLPPEYDEIFEALVDCGTLALYRDALKLEMARAKDAAAKGERKSGKLYWSEAAQLAVAVRGKVERQRAKREAGPSREPGRPVGLDEALARDVERFRRRQAGAAPTASTASQGD